MHRDDQRHLIERLKKITQAADKGYEDLRAVTGADLESPLLVTLFRAVEFAREQVAERIGDEWDWLEWHATENDWGAKGLKASPPNGGEPRKIADVDALLDLMKASHAAMLAHLSLHQDQLGAMRTGALVPRGGNGRGLTDRNQGLITARRAHRRRAGLAPQRIDQPRHQVTEPQHHFDFGATLAPCKGGAIPTAGAIVERRTIRQRQAIRAQPSPVLGLLQSREDAIHTTSAPVALRHDPLHKVNTAHRRKQILTQLAASDYTLPVAPHGRPGMRARAERPMAASIR